MSAKCGKSQQDTAKALVIKPALLPFWEEKTVNECCLNTLQRTPIQLEMTIFWTSLVPS